MTLIVLIIQLHLRITCVDDALMIEWNLTKSCKSQYGYVINVNAKIKNGDLRLQLKKKNKNDIKS